MNDTQIQLRHTNFNSKVLNSCHPPATSLRRFLYKINLNIKLTCVQPWWLSGLAHRQIQVDGNYVESEKKLTCCVIQLLKVTPLASFLIRFLNEIGLIMKLTCCVIQSIQGDSLNYTAKVTVT